MTAPRRDPFALTTTHGGGRTSRPAYLDVKALERFNAGTTRAVMANRGREERERQVEADRRRREGWAS